MLYKHWIIATILGTCKFAGWFGM